MTITMRNNYLTRDQQGNWTSNSLNLSYWEKGQHADLLGLKALEEQSL